MTCAAAPRCLPPSPLRARRPRDARKQVLLPAFTIGCIAIHDHGDAHGDEHRHLEAPSPTSKSAKSKTPKKGERSTLPKVHPTPHAVHDASVVVGSGGEMITPPASGALHWLAQVQMIGETTEQKNDGGDEMTDDRRDCSERERTRARRSERGDDRSHPWERKLSESKRRTAAARRGVRPSSARVVARAARPPRRSTPVPPSPHAPSAVVRSRDGAGIVARWCCRNAVVLL